jgi:ketosteroid isomerase-like protein
MSQEDLDGVRAAWEAISANDYERFVEAVDPDVEFTSLVAEPDAVTYRGHKGVRRWWDTMKETFVFRTEAEALEAAARTRREARSRA